MRCACGVLFSGRFWRPHFGRPSVMPTTLFFTPTFCSSFFILLLPCLLTTSFSRLLDPRLNSPRNRFPSPPSTTSRTAAATFHPILMFHGLDGSASVFDSVRHYIDILHPGTRTFSLSIFDGAEPSIFNGLLTQIEGVRMLLHETIEKNSLETYHFLGMSMGNIVLRGIIEMYGEEFPGLVNYYSLVGPHGGQFGVPNVPLPKWILELPVEEIAQLCYRSEFQEVLSFCGFWKDPFDMRLYWEKSLVLAYLNNETLGGNPVSKKYRENLLRVNEIFLFGSSGDCTLFPWQTAFFDFFKPGSVNESDVVHLRDSKLWKDDWIGLRTLDEQSRFWEILVEGADHKDWLKHEYLIVEYIIPVLT